MKSYITIFGFAIFLEMIYLMPVFAAESGYYAGFDINHQTAFHLYNIDLQYNRSIDSLSSFFTKIPNPKKIEQCRFNYQDTNGFSHVVYGNPNSLVNTSIIEFTFDSTNSISSFSDQLSDSSLARFCVDIINRNDSIVKAGERQKISLSPYIFVSKDTITLYFVPSFQTSGMILLSSNYFFKYRFDRKSNQIELLSADSEHVETRKYDPKESREIVLDYKDKDVPPVSSLFFAHIYFPYFEKIDIETKEKNTYLLNIQSGNYVHINKSN